MIQSRAFQNFFLVKSTIKDLYLHGMTAYDASAKIKNTPVSDVEFHSGRMEVHIHTHKNEHNVCMACTYIRFATKRFYMYPQTFPKAMEIEYIRIKRFNQKTEKAYATGLEMRYAFF